MIEQQPPKSKALLIGQQFWLYWKPLVVATAAYSILAFLCSVAAANSTFNGGVWLLFIDAALVLSMSQLTGVFAALGSWSYLWRLAISQSCGLVFFLSLYGGLTVASTQNWDPTAAKYYLCVSAIASLVSQSVYWFFRIVCRWRFHQTGTKRGDAYTLQDLFAATLFLAVVLAIVNMVRGSAFIQNSGSETLLVFVVAIFVFTLIYGAPTLLATAHSVDDYGCGVQLVILVLVGFIAGMPLVTIGAANLIVPLVVLLCGTSLFLWLPLALMREQGFQLSNGNDDNREH